MGDSVELSPAGVGACIFETLTAETRMAHVRIEASSEYDTDETTYDLYVRNDTAMLASIKCEADGSCGWLHGERCRILEDYLDCSQGNGDPRVCGVPTSWCVELTPVMDPQCP